MKICCVKQINMVRGNNQKDGGIIVKQKAGGENENGRKEKNIKAIMKHLLSDWMYIWHIFCDVYYSRDSIVVGKW